MGLFVSLEGGEGSGKTTQLSLLADFLRAEGNEVLTTREPGGTDGAENIRRLVVQGHVDQWDSISETLLFLAARRDHYRRVIFPAISEKKIVLCDRFIDSTLVYQGIAKGLGVEYVRQLHRLSLGRIEPHITLLFDISPEHGLARARNRAGTETRFEALGLDFHQRIRQGFLSLAAETPERIRVIDASGGVEEVAAHTRKALLSVYCAQ